MKKASRKEKSPVARWESGAGLAILISENPMD
jgi:hypothetical protein